MRRNQVNRQSSTNLASFFNFESPRASLQEKIAVKRDIGYPNSSLNSFESTQDCRNCRLFTTEVFGKNLISHLILDSQTIDKTDWKLRGSWRELVKSTRFSILEN